MASTNKSIPFVVPTQLAPPIDGISQTELQLLLSLRGRLKQLQEEITAEEESLKKRLEAGAEIEPDHHSAALKESNRRNVSRKAIVVRLALRLKMDGEAYCDRVLAATKPTKTVSLEVQ
jgi:hypothetical protein